LHGKRQFADFVQKQRAARSTVLDLLIAALDPQPEDTIVTLGDFVDRRPDSSA
jgi:hypothetical protein